MAKFKVKITGVGKIWDVDFFPDKDKNKSVKFNLSFDRKEWISDEFEYKGEILIYELFVFARRGTAWDGEIEQSGKVETFLTWRKSKTNQNHESRRTRPIKIISENTIHEKLES